MEEEELLVAELKRIESRKKEREKKSHDINKLITAAESKPSLSSSTAPASISSSSLDSSGGTSSHQHGGLSTAQTIK